MNVHFINFTASVLNTTLSFLTKTIISQQKALSSWMIWHNLETSAFVYTCSIKMQSSGYLQRTMVCCCNVEKQPCFVAHNLQKVSHRVSTFTCSKTSLRLLPVLSVSEIEMLFSSFSFLFSYTRWGGVVRTWRCIGHKAGKYPIHHRDNKDKHILTYRNFRGFEATWFAWLLSSALFYCLPPYTSVWFSFFRNTSPVQQQQLALCYFNEGNVDW